MNLPGSRPPWYGLVDSVLAGPAASCCPGTPGRHSDPVPAGPTGAPCIAGRRLHADQLGHLHLGAALGAGGGGLVLVVGEQAATGRAGLGERRLPEREIAVRVAVAA